MTLFLAYNSDQKSMLKKIWLYVLFSHSKRRKILVVRRYTFAEEPKVYLNISKTITLREEKIAKEKNAEEKNAELKNSNIDQIHTLHFQISQ